MLSGTEIVMVSSPTFTTPAAPASKVRTSVGCTATTVPSTRARMSAVSTEMAMATPRLPSWNTAVSAPVAVPTVPPAWTTTLPSREVIVARGPTVACEVSWVTPRATENAYSMHDSFGPGCTLGSGFVQSW